jgi:hypothetical protein
VLVSDVASSAHAAAPSASIAIVIPLIKNHALLAEM